MTSVKLPPARADVARHLRRYRAWQRLLLAHPADRSVRIRFEDSAYKLCALMGEHKAREAADAAEQYLRPRAPRTPRTPHEPGGGRTDDVSFGDALRSP
ncbi:DUF5133 domain-containing protein [Streptomyces sp. KL118A]|uniref:DUF5133 domain-containing protein n=1 Tax=Streptomyces sp. KL118A TaxID=3045153 RepID=UPI00278C62B9|nr:DUF5133 domain-containing protein [Streptomyces sp. KL118A]